MTYPKKKVIIIGAGWAGIIAGKTYLQLAKLQGKPIDLIIFDRNATVGGVWSRDNIHSGLVANSPVGYYEYSDMSMKELGFDDSRAAPADRVQAYLEAYAKRFGVFEHIRFGIKVASVQRKIPSAANPNLKEWIVKTDTGEAYECASLIIATGLHSIPKEPQISKSAYEGTVLHSQQLGSFQKTLTKESSVQDVVVVGGCKSAVEACSVLRYAGKRVHWVIRPSEQGVPLTVIDVYALFNQVIAAMTRVFVVCSPSIYDTTSFWYRFVHSCRSKLGNALRKLYWSGMTEYVKWPIHYRKSRNGRNIEPRRKTLFLDTVYIAVIQQGHPFLKWLHADDPEIMTVYRCTPTNLKGREMITIDEDGNEVRIKADAVVYATGWRPSYDLFSVEDRLKLGLPVALSSLNTDTQRHHNNLKWRELLQIKDREVRSLFPYFNTDTTNPDIEIDASTSESEDGAGDDSTTPRASSDEQQPLLNNPSQELTSSRPPQPTPKGLEYTPIKLYHHILPITSVVPGDTGTKDRSISFVGHLSSSRTAQVTEIQALWAIAWHESLVYPQISPTTAESTTALTQAWMLRRFGPRASFEPLTILETQSYLDMLCQDLHIEHQRKRIWWPATRFRRPKWFVRLAWWPIRMITAPWRFLAEWCTPYRASDYRGIVDEFWDACREKWVSDVEERFR